MSREVPLDTQRRQAQASRPDVSAWVSANAGSGKTHVLSQRVVRLLLEGAPPSKILCLTFTKAAAANMSLRVFSTLSGWTRLDDAALASEIARMQGGEVPEPAMLVRARRLFARAVETPGGLKIQTIHAFCERLLHLFPFEANVAAGFEVLAEDEQQEMLAIARARAFADAAREEHSESARALAVLSAETTETGFGDLISAALKYRTAIAEAIRNHQGARNWGVALGDKMGLAAGEDVASVEREIMQEGIDPKSWASIAQALGADGSGKNTCGNRLATAALAPVDSKLAAYLLVFLTKDRAPRAASYIVKKVRDSNPDLVARMDAEQERLVRLLDKRRCVQAVGRSVALFHVIERILVAYAELKSLRGLLDFDDLIERTHRLLTRSKAAWVLYKLDAGIDHILVDEAQDTSPQQWRILQAIAEEFMSGEGARGHSRTFFAVGDEKQSIFSFQGAEPGTFDKMRKQFGERIAHAVKAFESIRLNLSFRSAAAVLDSVDCVFDDAANRFGVVAKDDNVWTPHESWKRDLPGLVEIWDEIAATGVENPAEWKLPLDRQDGSDPAVIVARRIAGFIRDWLSPQSTEAVHGDNGAPRKIRAGDILILVRSRSGFFEAVIRALKDARVPVAGADRLVLNEHIAVMDLVAVGRASLLPEDDLTLACVLKSPLIGLDDDDLIALAPNRKGSLAQALENSPEPRHRAAAELLAHWRMQARDLSPFRFYSGILGAGGGRRQMLARLGPEAGDAIDEFIRLTLTHERMSPPSLVTFLHELESAEIEIKRDMEAAGDAVRVMTVHAAKGLESKIVFLPDTMGSPSGRHDPKIFDLSETRDGEWLVWARGSKHDPAALEAIRQSVRDAQDEEYRRLLYVAMTRAEERLYIAGFYGVQRPKKGWYDIVRNALGPHCREEPSWWDASENVLRFGPGMRLPSPEIKPASIVAPLALPDWLRRPAPFEAAPAPPVSPSTALAAADQNEVREPAGADLAAASAAIAGRLMHALLQHLPEIDPARRGDIGRRFLTARGAGLSGEQRERILIEALGLLDDPALADLFAPGSRVEVPIAGRLLRPNGKHVEIAGQIDRLSVLPDMVLAADYKTGRPRGGDETPEAYVTQLGLYRAVLSQLYPDRPVRALLVWTAGPAVVELDVAQLDAAVARVTGR